MKRYSLSFGRSLQHTPEHPERTAVRTLSWDVEYQVWPSAAAMQATIGMQARGPYHRRHWAAWQPRKAKVQA